MGYIRFFGLLARWFAMSVVAWFMRQLFNATIGPWFQDILGTWQNWSRQLYLKTRHKAEQGVEVVVESAEAVIHDLQPQPS